MVELTCYVMDGWNPRIRPASREREWMENSPERFAYRCLPLAIANSHGWELLSPCGFEARWNGGLAPEDVEIRLDPGTSAHHAPVALFGQATFTFHVQGLFRTPPGWNLWVGPLPNSAKDGVAALGGIIETDWSPYTFTMNWRFTRKDHWIRFEENEPYALIFPIQRHVVAEAEPKIVKLEDAPEVERQFRAWSKSRDAFHERMRTDPPAAPADKWQKHYYRGLLPDGSPGTDDHVSKLRAPAVKCPMGFDDMSRAKVTPRRPDPVPDPATDIAVPSPEPEPRPAAAVQASPAQALGLDAEQWEKLRALGLDQRFGELVETLNRAGAAAPPPPEPEPAPPPPPGHDMIELRRARWVLETQEAQRALSRYGDAIREVETIEREDFLEHYYAASRPLIVRGIARDWPAVTKWTPAYLAGALGAVDVVYQGGRNDNPTYELDKDAHTRSMPFDAFIDRITSDGPGNDAYVTAYNDHRNSAAFAPLRHDLGRIDAMLTDRPGLMWIGPGGTFTPLHHDLTNNLLVQLVGTKHIVTLPPSETPKLANYRHVFSEIHDINDPDRLARFPQARTARRFDVELRAGDALFMPVGWWHQVAAEDFSVMLTYTGFHWPNEAGQAWPQEN